jgi:hypothetical protein
LAIDTASSSLYRNDSFVAAIHDQDSLFFSWLLNNVTGGENFNKTVKDFDDIVLWIVLLLVAALSMGNYRIADSFLEQGMAIKPSDTPTRQLYTSSRARLMQHALVTCFIGAQI